jgi:hypothetical protein
MQQTICEACTVLEAMSRASQLPVCSWYGFCAHGGLCRLVGVKAAFLEAGGLLWSVFRCVSDVYEWQQLAPLRELHMPSTVHFGVEVVQCVALERPRCEALFHSLQHTLPFCCCE